MEVITNNYNNISVSQLHLRLAQQYTELDKSENSEKQITLKFNDYIERVSNSSKNYKQQDYERVLSKLKTSDSSTMLHDQKIAASIVSNYNQGSDEKMYEVKYARINLSMQANLNKIFLNLKGVNNAS
jgi:hypothetical protein